MIGIVMALLSASVFGLTVVLIRKRLDESNFVATALVLTVTGNMLLWPIALFLTDLRTANIEGVLLFAIAGFLAPGIARLCYYKGMELVGVSANASIFATYPLYSSMLAVLFLGESLSIENWFGIACIALGVVNIERSFITPKSISEKISKKGLVFPLLASLAIAFSQNVRKQGLNLYNEPLFGVAISYSTSLLLYLPILILSSANNDSFLSVKDFRLFWKAGIGMSVGWILSFYALSQEDVSIVTPLLQTEPMFVLLFVYIYLKKIEKVSSRLALSTLLIVAGVILVGSS